MKKFIIASLLFIAFSCQAAETGNIPFQTVRLVYTGQVTTSVWTQVTAGIPFTVTKVSTFDSSGQTLKLGFGKSGSEADMPYIIFPGGNGGDKVFISPNTRISIKALSGTASSGELDINFFI